MDGSPDTRPQLLDQPSARSQLGADTAPATPQPPGPTLSQKPGRTRTIALMNQKGGVGKTTTTVNLGAALADAGHRVLLVDLDPQAHMTLHVGVDSQVLEHTVYDLLVDAQLTVEQVIYPVTHRLALLPSEVNLAGIEAELAPKMITGRAQHVLKQKCGGILGRHAEGTIDSQKDRSDDSPNFDYVLIDCPPSLGLLTVNALTMASEVIVPMQAQFLALQGLSKLLETVGMIQQSFNPRLRVTGVVVCMHERQTILAGEVMADLTAFLESARDGDEPWSEARILSPPIRRNIKLAECPSFGRTIFDYAPMSHGAEDYRLLAASVRQLVANTPSTDS